MIQYKPPPTVERFMLSDARWRALLGPFGCLSADTEFLTPTGWKRMDQWEEDLVAEFDTTTNRIAFQKPQEYVVLPCDSFLHLKNKYGVDQLLSDEHTVLFNTRFKPEEWRTIPALELAEKHNKLKDGWSGRIPTTFDVPERTRGTALSDDELRLMVAVCADGGFSAAPTTRCNIIVRKERKKVRARSLLAACGIAWTEHVYEARPTETAFRFYAPQRNKTLAKYWGASFHQLAVILDEAQHWDGCVDCYGGMIFSSCDKPSADLIQYAAASQGKRATVTPVKYDNEKWRTGYRVYVNTSPSTSLSMRQAPKIERVKSEDGLKYCFTTGTGFFVARRNGRIFVTGNSGKSSGCCMEILRRATQQRRGPDGYRRTRWAVVRNTAPQLRDTTIKTWLSWFPNGSIGYWHTSTKTYYIEAGDVRAEVMFRALDDAQDIKNLLSLELTGAWFNECREIPKEIVEAMDGRIPRYPAIKDGGQTWCGMFGDTNPPEEFSYWYHIFEHLNPEDSTPAPKDEWWDVFKQPSGLSPEAENLDWLEPGYYTNLARGKTKDFVRVNVEGKYGRSKAGKAVHPTFDEDFHVAKDFLIPNPRQILVIAADFGLTPALVLKQQNPFGQVLTFDEIVTENMGIKRAIREKLKPLLRNKYDGFDIRITGDPAGNTRSQNDEKSCATIFKEEGFKKVKFAWSNTSVHRIGATDSYLTRITENGPAYLIDPRCHFLKRGMSGGYHYPINTKGEVSPGPKKNIYSHVCFVAGTLIDTPYGAIEIENLPIGVHVSTPLGPREVVGRTRVPDQEVIEAITTDGRRLVGTADHPIWVAEAGGFIPLEALWYTCITTTEDNLWNALFWLWHYAGRPSTQSTSSTEFGITESRPGITKRMKKALSSICTGLFGFETTDQSPTGTRFTTETRTRGTTTQATSNSSASTTTTPCICESLSDSNSANRQSKKPRLAHLDGDGITQKQPARSEEKGLQEQALSGGEPLLISPAFIVGDQPLATRAENTTRSSVPPRASPLSGVLQALMTKIAYVAYVALASVLIATQRPKRVRLSALGRIPARQDVYNIEVEEAHCYYANGILVSNCEAGQYGDMYFERGADTQAQSKEIQQMLLAQQRMAGAYSTRN